MKLKIGDILIRKFQDPTYCQKVRIHCLTPYSRTAGGRIAFNLVDVQNDSLIMHNWSEESLLKQFELDPKIESTRKINKVLDIKDE